MFTVAFMKSKMPSILRAITNSIAAHALFAARCRLWRWASIRNGRQSASPASAMRLPDTYRCRRLVTAYARVDLRRSLRPLGLKYMPTCHAIPTLPADSPANARPLSLIFGALAAGYAPYSRQMMAPQHKNVMSKRFSQCRPRSPPPE